MAYFNEVERASMVAALTCQTTRYLKGVIRDYLSVTNAQGKYVRRLARVVLARRQALA